MQADPAPHAKMFSYMQFRCNVFQATVVLGLSAWEPYSSGFLQVDASKPTMASCVRNTVLELDIWNLISGCHQNPPPPSSSNSPQSCATDLGSPKKRIAPLPEKTGLTISDTKTGNL